MRKTSKITLVALLALALVATLCACGLLNGATALTIESMPRTSYTTEDKAYDWTGFTLRVYTNTKKDGYKQDGNRWYKDFSYDDLMKEGSKDDFSVTPFAKGQVGTHTAQIRYLGLSVSFNYTVSESLFAGGEGTKANPYQISTVEQFKNIGNNTNLTYFKLINDLDFESKIKEAVLINAKNYVLDGNNFSLRGVNDSITRIEHSGDEIVIKNLDIYANIVENGGYGLFGAVTVKKATFSNINIYGSYIAYTDQQNESIFINGYNGNELVIDDVQIYADMITKTSRGAVFIGQYIKNAFSGFSNNTIVTISNSNFYGYAEAARFGLILGNSGACDSNVSFSITDVHNYGKIYATHKAYEAFCYYADTEPDNNNVMVNGKTVKEYNATSLVAGSGKTETIRDATLAVTKDTNEILVITKATKNVTKYVITASVWTKEYATADAAREVGTNTFCLYTWEYEGNAITWDGNKFSTEVKALRWNVKVEYTELTEENGKYCLKDGINNLGTYVKDISDKKITYTVWAYDGDKLIGAVSTTSK